MSRELLLEMARRSRAHAEAGTTDQAEGVIHIPAGHYCDTGRWAREQARIFRRLPLVLGFSVELAGAGDYRSLTVADTPVLLTRGRDGKVRGFLNACRHRGAQIRPSQNPELLFLGLLSIVLSLHGHLGGEFREHLRHRAPPLAVGSRTQTGHAAQQGKREAWGWRAWS